MAEVKIVTILVAVAVVKVKTGSNSSSKYSRILKGEECGVLEPSSSDRYAIPKLKEYKNNDSVNANI